MGQRKSMRKNVVAIFDEYGIIVKDFVVDGKRNQVSTEEKPNEE